MTKIQDLFNGIRKVFEPYLKERGITDVDSWDGSASRWPDTESYCNSCLINLNEGDSADWTQGNCKLPVRNPGDSADTYVRQAVHAAAARFNQVDAPTEAKESARRELVRAYNEMDEEPPEVLTRAMSNNSIMQMLHSKMFELDDQIEGSDHYLVDMYYDDGGMYALYTDRGKLYRYPLMVRDNDLVLGTRTEVMEVHQPVMTRTTITRQADGRYRWFSVSGTAVLNRSGEIDSRDLFDSFVQHAEETGIYPIRMFYHQGHVSRDGQADEQAQVFRVGQADYLARDGYCYITSGLYDDTPLAQTEIEARQNNPDEWGDSIGFWPWDMSNPHELTEITDGISIPVYKDGINVEITTLPEREASHLFTRTEVQRMALNGKAREAFIKMWVDAGQTEEDALKWLEENPTARNRSIEQSGLITRDLKELISLYKEDEDKALEWLEQRANEDVEVEESDEEPEEPQQDVEIVLEDEAIAAVTQAVVESEAVQQLTEAIETERAEHAKQVDALNGKIDKLTQRIVRLEKGEAQEQRQIADDTPTKFNSKTRVVVRPREQRAEDGDGMTYSQRANTHLPKGAY